MLAPLRFGAGLKGKLVEAMQCGTPSITTDIGAEGLIHDSGWPGAICNDTDTFADAAVKLFSDIKEWQKAQQLGPVIINKKFADPDYEGQFINRINRMVKNLQTHRSKNFVGQMLRHHTLASTEYMGRWIEEKNSK
jgi:glycosyltransferase involved in cell wall biosynthesis